MNKKVSEIMAPLFQAINEGLIDKELLEVWLKKRKAATAAEILSTGSATKELGDLELELFTLVTKAERLLKQNIKSY